MELMNNYQCVLVLTVGIIINPDAMNFEICLIMAYILTTVPVSLLDNFENFMILIWITAPDDHKVTILNDFNDELLLGVNLYLSKLICL